MIRKLLEILVDHNGSDLHLKAGNKPIIRVNGELYKLEDEPRLFANDIEDCVETVLENDDRRKDLKENLSCDFSYSVNGVGRFRINISRSRGSYMLVARAIPFGVPSIDELNLPGVLKEIAKERNGIILVTGATGSGKSTTVAALLDYINTNYKKNIISFEEPIEFLHRDKQSMVNQKEVPDDIRNYADALKYVLRQDPDIIFIGELRDAETIEAAMKASETGHLVISTLHTINAQKTISRLLDYYPADKAKALRYQLSENLRAVVSQRMLKTVDSNKQVAMEIMINTSTIAELLLTEEGMEKIPEIITKNETMGMQTFDREILRLYQQGTISYEVAHEASSVKTMIDMAKNGIVSDFSSFYE